MQPLVLGPEVGLKGNTRLGGLLECLESPFIGRTHGGMWPRWRADGKEPENKSGSWPNSFDVTADGERFVVVRPVRDERAKPEIVVVQNWMKEFAER